MTFNIKQYQEIRGLLRKFYSQKENFQPQLIAVSKNQPISSVIEAIHHGILTFAENKVQEATIKFEELKKNHKGLDLHMTGPLQTNKVKKALKIFDCFHTLDREKLAKELFKHMAFLKITTQKKFFVQVNTGNEKQKSGISSEETTEFVNYCIKELRLNVIGLMCIPPINEDAKTHFVTISKLARENNLNFLSMGMSSDYQIALECGSTHIRIGTLLFGQRE